MPSWNELLQQLGSLPSDADRAQWLPAQLHRALHAIGQKRGSRHVIFYASAFLQKPHTPPMWLQLMSEEINGLMAVMHGMDWSRGLVLVLHTPGGATNAAETVVSYLREKFGSIECVVPTFAMSAGTMIALATDKIIMGRQSQLGPIDPQMPMDGRTVSARAVVDQFAKAKSEILADVKTAHVWAPILQRIGPSLLLEAENALEYSERMVARWLERWMFSQSQDPGALGRCTAQHFNDAGTHKSHGRRIDRAEAREHGVVVEDLEDDQDLQEAILTAYHLTTLIFEKTPASKLLFSDHGKAWVKNFVG